MCGDVYACLYTHVCMFMHAQVHMHMHSHMHSHACTRVQVHTHTLWHWQGGDILVWYVDQLIHEGCGLMEMAQELECKSSQMTPN